MKSRTHHDNGEGPILGTQKAANKSQVFSVLRFFHLFVLSFFVFSACAQEPAPLPQYECFRVKNIQVDGVLDELEWKSLPEINFVLGDGKKPERGTKAKLAWNEEFLFIAVWITDDEILADVTTRDGPIWHGEAVEFFVKPQPSMKHYFEFEFNALGACSDYYVSAPRRVWSGWDSQLNWKIKKDSKSWQLEVAVPLSVFRLTSETLPKEGVVWRANLFRIEKGGSTELSYWSPLIGEDPDFHQPEKFGKLIFREKSGALKDSKSNPKP
jgi:hypothetical protein